MNPEAQELLNKLLLKDPESLSEDEISFLKARKSYLTKAQAEDYKSVLEPKPAVEQTVKSDAKKQNN